MPINEFKKVTGFYPDREGSTRVAEPVITRVIWPKPQTIQVSSELDNRPFKLLQFPGAEGVNRQTVKKEIEEGKVAWGQKKARPAAPGRDLSEVFEPSNSTPDEIKEEIAGKIGAWNAHWAENTEENLLAQMEAERDDIAKKPNPFIW